MEDFVTFVQHLLSVLQCRLQHLVLQHTYVAFVLCVSHLLSVSQGGSVKVDLNPCNTGYFGLEYVVSLLPDRLVCMSQLNR